MSFLFIVADYASSPISGRIKERVLSHVRVAFLVLHTHMPISQAYCTQYKQALPCWNCHSFKFCKLFKIWSGTITNFQMSTFDHVFTSRHYQNPQNSISILTHFLGKVLPQTLAQSEESGVWTNLPPRTQTYSPTLAISWLCTHRIDSSWRITDCSQVLVFEHFVSSLGLRIIENLL